MRYDFEISDEYLDYLTDLDDYDASGAICEDIAKFSEEVARENRLSDNNNE